jgi:hypothetical protein
LGTGLAAHLHMGITRQAVRFGHRRLTGRLARALPWVGTAVALLTIGSTIRRKGVVGGTIDSALDAIPVVGTLKGLAETVRGRDFVRERAPRQSAVTNQTRLPGNERIPAEAKPSGAV